MGLGRWRTLSRNRTGVALTGERRGTCNAASFVHTAQRAAAADLGCSGREEGHMRAAHAGSSRLPLGSGGSRWYC